MDIIYDPAFVVLGFCLIVLFTWSVYKDYKKGL